MHSDYLDRKFIQQLNKHLELINNHIKPMKYKSNLTRHLIHQTFININQRYELRNNYYHRKFPLLLHDLCLIKSNKNYFQLIEKQYYHSTQFYKKILNIQSITNIEQYQQQFEQSNKCLNDLKHFVKQYENDIDQLKEKIMEQNKQINLYSNNLFQIQFNRNQIQSNIQQLKQQILFEKQLYNEIKQSFISNPKLTLKINDINPQKIIGKKQQNQNPTLNNDFLHQFHTEYNRLSTQMTQIKLNIEQKSIDLLSLQSEFDIDRTVLNVNDMNFTKSKDQSLLLPTTTTTTDTKDTHHQSALLINRFNKNIIQSELRQLPIECVRKSEYTKSKSRKSKANYQVFLTIFKHRNSRSNVCATNRKRATSVIV